MSDRNDLAPYRRLTRHILIALLGWLLLIGGAVGWSLYAEHSQMQTLVRNAARAHFSKDQAFRLWAASHGGVYVPATERTPPNPYLKHLEERDLLTPSGRQLTLMNPAYMLRQMMAEHEGLYGSRGNIVSLKPMNPVNTPDPWQEKALRALEDGAEEVLEFTVADGVPVLRMMRPMVTGADCLKCHARQGYRIGDIRGGVGVMVPLTPYLTEAAKVRGKLLAAFLVIGLTGLAIIGLLYRRGRQRLNEQLRYENELLAARDEWERTFDAIDDIITIFDRNMRVIRTNKASSRISKMQPEAIKGKSCHELFRSSPVPCPDCPTVEQRKQGISANATVQHGSRIFAISCAPLTNKKGELTGFVHIAKDITDQRHLESRLRQAQKMEAIGTLAGGIAHDFNNILTPITGFTELAMGKLPPESPAGGDLKQVVRAAGRARELVRQILTFSRKSDSEFRPLKVEPIIKEALKLMRSTLPTTIEIRQNIDDNCGMVMADPGQLHQVMMNLCTNAYHAMREGGGVLAVGLESLILKEEDARLVEPEMKPGPYLHLTVNDNGCGMERATMERMFEPYYTTKSPGEGTGLGMAVVHGIIRQHGGKISAYSEPGRGTTVHVYLPELRAENGLKREEDDPEAPLPGGRGERVLVVDDDKIIAIMLHHMLTHLGYRVDSFNEPREALALIREQPGEIDLLITDMTMPHLTGAELATKAMAAAPDLRVILCTGFSELIDQEKSRQLGIHAFLMKPVTLRQIAVTVDKVLHE
ncbi:MAG: ATP-binding protein [Desulfurivibrio sp.]